MTLFKFHFIVIFMYTTLFMIVLFKLPFKYDRIIMNKAERKALRKRKAKNRNKNRRNKHISNSNDFLHRMPLVEKK